MMAAGGTRGGVWRRIGAPALSHGVLLLGTAQQALAFAQRSKILDLAPQSEILLEAGTGMLSIPRVECL